MAYISEFQILDEYQIQEATLSHLSELGLLPDSESKRGRIVYPKNKNLDFVLRAAKAHYIEVFGSKLRLIPCFRAFLALAIAEGPNAAWSLLNRRGFFDRYKKSELVSRWKAFKAAVPKELKKFIKGDSDTVTEQVEVLLKILGIEEAFHDPDLLKLNEIYDDIALQQDVDSLLLAKAQPAMISEVISHLHYETLQLGSIEAYRHYYFDVDMLTAGDFSAYIKHYPPGSSYRRVLTLALTEKNLVAFTSAANYPARFNSQEILRNILGRCMQEVNVLKAGPVTVKQARNATRDLISIVDSLEKHAAEQDDGVEDMGDLLRLRYDTEMNESQMVVGDIPEKDFDFASSSHRRDDQTEEGSGEPA